MIINQITTITFSPTGTSSQISKAIVEGCSPMQHNAIDLTRSSAVTHCISNNTLTIFAVPVYGGHVAPLALKRLSAIKGQNSPAVIVVVYGNRHYEAALQQLHDFVTKQHFCVIAAATFIGEHSYSTEQTPIAAGRPDGNDLDAARNFGKEIIKKLNCNLQPQPLTALQIKNIKKPKQHLISKLRFILTILKWRQQGKAMPRSPQTLSNLCNHCGRCVDVCPNQAITKGDECNTLSERCIRCCACVKSCPKQARQFNTPFAPLLSRNFKRRKEPQTLL
ncbi:MAG: 4Fe-4S binding protein [Muribaculaceae bacterium]